MNTVLKEQELVADIFSKILYKINFSNKKGNNSLLSIDLLKEKIRKELLSITASKLERLYITLLNQKPSASFTLIQKKGNIILLLLLKDICEEFLNKQYGYHSNISFIELKKSIYTENLLQDIEILFNVPFYVLSDQKAPKFRLIYYPIYNKASNSFIEALIDNLILEICNCVVYFLTLNFSSVYVFRQSLYRSKFLSIRNFERFKNNLSWQARVKKYIKRPFNLYSNKYEVYILSANGISCRTIYANRPNEIKDLSKLPLLTIASVEIKDFVSSRFDETLYTIVKGARFTLTSVVGQGIGLIWRGIIDGLKK